MKQIEIVDVTARDGFQSVVPWIATNQKIRIIRKLFETGLRRMEVGAFVSPKHVPQMKDALRIHGGLQDLNGASLYYLVPNPEGLLRAAQAGVQNFSYVISASNAHNLANIGRSIDSSVQELKVVWPEIEARVTSFKLALSTCFYCPFNGEVLIADVINIVEKVRRFTGAIEVDICDTTGRATPDKVERLFGALFERFSGNDMQWAFHGHDTYGLGVANAIAAYKAGVRVVEGSTGGLGGCPFAPGSSGNTATEDLVFAFEAMGIKTGIDLRSLLSVADEIVNLDGVTVGGHIRNIPRDRVFN
ncbi:4-hydroxy 2-oxovalerate aldolase [Glaciecola punicea ACAM 611]|uniref:4-hydroxy 2-oxovalerate aldolase n=1 Tax=Glaciecola punicea ACAM 611 TaxID=1121923 RepID=H5TE85_9ALTE|nr:hydroxymethylglutaryl-CoA lyase [Glaciecola punicea]GAB56612.1 4-hydroxy 2-oxovalerate aldolase [Glaciecola punicea ACAM 611]